MRLTPDILGSHPVSLVYRREIGDEAPVRAVICFVTAVIKDHAAMISGEPLGGSRIRPVDLAK